MTSDAPKPGKPAHTIRRYGIEVAIWRNEGETRRWSFDPAPPAQPED